MSRSPAPPPLKKSALVAPLAGLAAGMILLAIATGFFLSMQMFGPGPRAANPAGTEVTFVRGTSVSGMARDLAKAHVIRSAFVFRVMAKLHGHGGTIKAGTYLFPAQASLMTVLTQMEQGKVEQTYVTIPEGRTSAQAVRILMAIPGLVGDVDVPPEGSILPETYLYQHGETRQAVLDQMLDAGRKTLADLWKARAPGLPFKTKEEALILASVVEKETGLARERPKVAAVFVNRLRNGMRLESDPTVIYGVSRGEPLGRGLFKSELEKPSPWNTYLINKLPITPIANPGKASLAAVLNPAPTNDLYFVADGTGGHVFAATYEEHLINVGKWRQIEAQAHAAAQLQAQGASASVASSSVSSQAAAPTPAPAVRTTPASTTKIAARVRPHHSRKKA